MVARISVFNSRELQGVIVAMKSFPRDLASEIRKANKAVIDPLWREAVAAGAHTVVEQRVLADTARVQVSDQNVTLRSAAVGRGLGGRVKPVGVVGGAEFGADRDKVTVYTRRSPKGGTHTVRRHTQRQFAPRRREGYVVFPALARVIPRIASLWVQTTVRTFYEAIERGRS